ncbi:MAG: hypothetical protein TR69_WS6001000222 [candidate division WS6 bacterium OLB20]|uniref:Uncharacterized protein n=1 Tax=candidate division WS6 bacterium OLB20 TaxID=1617426 RepID=A0A136M0D3_9BACT|nr:MAG: hypothetical protein TR69_WS6001000222 [candidate division WS6 bacterium OLB20]
MLETQFFDELVFKTEAILKFRTIHKQYKKEILSYISRMREITTENIALLNKNAEENNPS